MSSLLEINDSVFIPIDELRFTATRSGGPGGQNVNKLNTRITLLFDLEKSAGLDDFQKQRVRERLANRINKDGVLRVVSQEHRTQGANRQAAIDHFARLIAAALKRRPTRRKTRIPRSVVERRLEKKSIRGEIKRSRRKPGSEGD